MLKVGTIAILINLDFSTNLTPFHIVLGGAGASAQQWGICCHPRRYKATPLTNELYVRPDRRLATMSR